MAIASKERARKYRARAEITGIEARSLELRVRRLNRVHNLLLRLADAVETGTLSPVLDGMTKTRILSLLVSGGSDKRQKAEIRALQALERNDI